MTNITASQQFHNIGGIFMLKVLFVSVRNAARSPMAEAILNLKANAAGYSHAARAANRQRPSTLPP
jgi:protein-tyrosine-phosphatase